MFFRYFCKMISTDFLPWNLMTHHYWFMDSIWFGDAVMPSHVSTHGDPVRKHKVTKPYSYSTGMISTKVQTVEPESTALIARFMGPTWGPSGADRTQVGPMLAPWTLLSWVQFRNITLLGNGIKVRTMLCITDGGNGGVGIIVTS